jgi:hypothetical protein
MFDSNKTSQSKDPENCHVVHIDKRLNPETFSRLATGVSTAKTEESALKLGRKFIGIDIDASNLTSQNRLQQHLVEASSRV